MEFQRLVWGLQRNLHKVRKPIMLFYGNGYESQLLLMALHKTRRKFIIVHVTFNGSLNEKTRNILRKFSQYNQIILCANPEDVKKKSWHVIGKTISIEKLDTGFSSEFYHMIFGIKIDELSLVKAWENNAFENLNCPFLRFPDEEIEKLYSDMVDTERMGKFMRENLTSDR
jgi:hypothetical protein